MSPFPPFLPIGGKRNGEDIKIKAGREVGMEREREILYLMTMVRVLSG